MRNISIMLALFMILNSRTALAQNVDDILNFGVLPPNLISLIVGFIWIAILILIAINYKKV
ncbi:MAG TPA: hypothetical protein VJH90_02335 [archaeon]|nr:hypothetical protein [archaeon]